MKPILTIIVFVLSLTACAQKKELTNVTSLMMHKYDVKALIEENNDKKCKVMLFNYSNNSLDKITTDFPCDQIKYFPEANKEDV